LWKRNYLLDKLQNQGIIDSITCELAKQEPLPGKPKPLPGLASHLLIRAMNEGNKGQNIASTLDINLQKSLQGKVWKYHQKMKVNHVYNAAALIADIETGNVLAYVGNVKSGNKHAQDVDIITSKRSTGSLLKPFLFALAVDEGLIMPEELLPDIPAFFQGFAPQNFNKKFNGAVFAKDALTRSLNVPFVFLLREYGYQKLHQKLKNLGMESLNKPAGHYGLSLILGGAESNLWELTALYGGLVRNLNNYFKYGIINNSLPDSYFQNNYLLGWKPEFRKVYREQISADAIWFTLNALQALTRPDEFSNWQMFKSGTAIAWKTGTSYGLKDAWAIGINNEYVVGVWLGNADGEGRPGLTGIRAAAPLLFDIFADLKGGSDFSKPKSLMKLTRICQKSGQKAGIYCPETVMELMPGERIHSKLCQYHKLIHLDKSKTQRVSSICYPVGEMLHQPWFILPPVQAWYYKQHQPDYRVLPEYLPGCNDNLQPKQYMEAIYPRHRSRVYIPTELDGKPGRVVFEIAHQIPKSQLFWHIDDEFLGKTQNIHQLGINPQKGIHEMRVVDEQGRELKIEFEVINE